MYKHLFFDLDNTVWNFDLNSWHAMKRVYLECGFQDEEYEGFFEIYNRHNDRLWELYRRNGIQKQELARQRFDLTFEEAGISGISGAEFNERYLQYMPLQTRLCDGAHEVLEKLSKRFKLHIITNGFLEVQHKKLEHSNLRPFFDRIFISEEIKSPKPSREIFMHALRNTNARKRESLMIGDSWDADVIGAMEAGIDQVHYAPHLSDNHFSTLEEQLLAKSSTHTYRILSLKELFAIVHIF
ncbi:MAG: YjjG family noncanonical pyrimidine nucleotidase [Bacteroidota bacterium]